MGEMRLDTSQLARRATAALQGRHPDASVTNVEQLIGGTSSLTYAADLRTGGRSDRIVIKAAPPGLEPVRNRDVLRQARILDVLAAVPDVAVPAVFGTDEGAPVEVPPLFVMDFVAGESYEPNVDDKPSTATPAEIEARAYGAVRMAAALHRVPTDDPRLAGERIMALDAELARWAKAFGSVDDDLKPGADAALAKLEANIPEPLPPSITHGDWRLGNMQCNGSSIDAVIDWEIWSLGDPRVDFAWMLLMADPGHPNKKRDGTGLPEPPALIAAYDEVAGRAIDDLGWFAALVRYKQAAAAALITKNNRKVPQPGVDPERTAAGIRPLLEWAVSYLP